MQLIVSLLLLLATASTAVAEDHLTPLDHRGLDLFIGYIDFVGQVYPDEFDELAGFYVWPSSKPARYLGILEPEESGSHFIFYAVKTEPQPEIRFTEISTEHAIALADRIAEIVRRNTFYSDRRLERIECVDGVEWVFASHRYYGKAYCFEPGTVPDRLTKVYDELAKIGSGNANSEDLSVTLNRVVKMLDDILVSIKQ